LVGAVTAGILFTVCLLRVHPFLAVTEPIGNGLLVVEGWMPDVVIPQVMGILEEGNYVAIVTTGGKVWQGSYLKDYGSFAEVMARSLRTRTQSIPVHAVPASGAEVDRTFASALALREWLAASGVDERRIDLVTDGSHARRSRLLFSLALGDAFDVGIFALEPSDFDSAIWWRSSAGVRTVIGEAVGYGYAKFLFWPESSDTNTQ
jgi:hypothetical protein